VEIGQCGFQPIRQQKEKGLGGSQRLKGDYPVKLVLDEETAAREAERCLGNWRCDGCRICVSFCPDSCITLSDDGVSVLIDYENCKGCGICAAVCPKSAIEMVFEEVPL
jgi:2-oxoacid:acceptor oxidoreductase delta subunit (pyruvate/2-ketoisovalerate family)